MPKSHFGIWLGARAIISLGIHVGPHTIQLLVIIKGCNIVIEKRSHCKELGAQPPEAKVCERSLQFAEKLKAQLTRCNGSGKRSFQALRDAKSGEQRPGVYSVDLGSTVPELR